MTDAPPPAEVPEGAAVFPLIPAELGVHPLLLATLHAVVFLSGSDEDVVQPPAAEEALQYLAGYLQRLDGLALRQVVEDMDCLVRFARQEKWPRQMVQFLKTFLADYGLSAADETK
jgi:hypothetical protein